MNAKYHNYAYSSELALFDPLNSADVSKGACSVLLAERDIPKDCQILCNYEAGSDEDIDIPFDNVSLAQFICICCMSARKCRSRPDK